MTRPAMGLRGIGAAAAAGMLALAGAVVLVDRITARGGSPAASAATPAGADGSGQAAPLGGLRPDRPAPAAAALAAPAHGSEPPREAPLAPQTPGVAKIFLSFKLDPRMTSGVHIGERWVSPPTYSGTGDARSVGMVARARAVEGDGTPSPAVPTWTASEPDMVDVSPDEGEQVRITVWRPGDSTLTVSSGAASRTLVVKAAERGGALRVAVVQ